MSNIDKMVARAIEICKDDSIGYSQINRWLNPDIDCSSMMYIVAGDQGGGYLTRWGSGYTGTMLQDFTKAGFTAIPFVGLNQLVKGDILLNVANHTEIYIGNSQFAGAHIDENGSIHGKQSGDQTGREVSIGAAYVYSRGWDYILRPGDSSGSSDAGSSGVSSSGTYTMVQTSSGNWRNDATTNSSIFATYDSGASVECVGFVYGQDPYGDGRNRWVKSKNNGKYAWEGLFKSSEVDKLIQL